MTARERAGEYFAGQTNISQIFNKYYSKHYISIYRSSSEYTDSRMNKVGEKMKREGGGGIQDTFKEASYLS